MKDLIVVIEGPRLAGKSKIFDHLKQLNNGPVPVFDHLIKDQSFSYIEEFSFISGLRSTVSIRSRLESYIIGKDVSLIQRLAETPGTVLVDRFLITSAVYSHVFRDYDVKMGHDYLNEVDNLLMKNYADLMERLKFFVIIPNVELALSEGLKGREGKDGLEDDEDLLNLQIELYESHSKFLKKLGYDITVLDSYHTNPTVRHQIGKTVAENIRGVEIQ